MNKARLCVIGLTALLLTGCSSAAEEARPHSAGEEILDSKWVKTGSLELSYADQFAVDYYEGGYSLISVADGLQYLTVPEGGQTPSAEALEDLSAILQTEKLPILIQLPVKKTYLAASSAMDLFRELDSLDRVRLTGTKLSDWSLPAIAECINEGRILYGGRYSAPDYELIFSEECDLAIESTMIYHTPETKEQLEKLGIPVLVERSSYESHPLGRVEWILLYGLLCGKEQEAQRFLEACKERLKEVEEKTAELKEEERPSVAFFYISSNGTVNIRKPGDYISRMIEMAGGRYVFSSLPIEDNALSTMNIDMETCYMQAKDADILIYNSTVGKELDDLQELLAIEPLLGDFAAVQKGRVFCTGQNLYQETTGAAAMVEDLYAAFFAQGTEEIPLTYLHRLKN